MTTDEKVVFEKQFGQAVADGKITNQKEAAQWAVLWMENSKIRELKTLLAQNAELVGLLNSLLTNCELGHWTKTVRAILSKYK